MTAKPPTQKDGEIRVYGNPEISSIMATFEAGIIRAHYEAGNYVPGSKARAKRVDAIRMALVRDVTAIIQSETQKAREETIKDARTALAIAATELKNIYSKADTTEKAIPQLRVNYMSQLDTALAALSAPNSKKPDGK